MTLARVICWFRGHLRGKRAYEGMEVDGFALVTYRCPRCKVEWMRKLRVTPAPKSS